MIFPEKPLRIVCTEAGSGTGETIYYASDGSVWEDDPFDHSNDTAPPEIRYERHGYLWSKP